MVVHSVAAARRLRFGDHRAAHVGEDPHNLVVSPDDGSHVPLAGWADTAPGATLRQSVTLGAGRYQLWCSLAGHEQQGMSADLVVE